jgi:hypothetical protein
VHWQIT